MQAIALPRTGARLACIGVNKATANARHNLRGGGALLGRGAAFAEVVPVPQPAADPRSSVVQPTEQSAHETAIMDCERMWDRGTHMTRQTGRRRVAASQNRLQQLELR